MTNKRRYPETTPFLDKCMYCGNFKEMPTEILDNIETQHRNFGGYTHWCSWECLINYVKTNLFPREAEAYVFFYEQKKNTLQANCTKLFVSKRHKPT